MPAHRSKWRQLGGGSGHILVHPQSMLPLHAKISIYPQYARARPWPDPHSARNPPSRTS